MSSASIIGKVHGASGTTLEKLMAARPGIDAYAGLLVKARRAKLCLKPPVSLKVVLAFESASGVRLPDDYVFFITMVGNGGTAPCRLVGLEDWNAGYWSETTLERDLAGPCLISPELEALGDTWLDALGVEEAEKKWDEDQWDPLQGTLAVAEIGCGLFYHLVVNGPHRGRVLVWGDRVSAPPLFEPQATFAGWIEFHLDAVIAGRPVHFLDGRIR